MYYSLKFLGKKLLFGIRRSIWILCVQKSPQKARQRRARVMHRRPSRKRLSAGKTTRLPRHEPPECQLWKQAETQRDTKHRRTISIRSTHAECVCGFPNGPRKRQHERTECEGRDCKCRQPVDSQIILGPFPRLYSLAPDLAQAAPLGEIIFRPGTECSGCFPGSVPQAAVSLFQCHSKLPINYQTNQRIILSPPAKYFLHY